MARGEMFIIAAPSGTGKDTLIREVISSLDGLEHSVSHTTRRARRGRSTVRTTTSSVARLSRR